MYENMPAPKPVMFLSWEDIVEQAKRHDRDLSRDQVLEIFNSIDDTGDFDTDHFWTAIDAATEGVLGKDMPAGESGREGGRD